MWVAIYGTGRLNPLFELIPFEWLREWKMIVNYRTSLGNDILEIKPDNDKALSVITFRSLFAVNVGHRK